MGWGQQVELGLVRGAHEELVGQYAHRPGVNSLGGWGQRRLMCQEVGQGLVRCANQKRARPQPRHPQLKATAQGMNR